MANASNLVLYLSQYMHLSPLKSANNVTNFMGTSFLLALLGGFLSDAFFTAYHIYLISAVIEFLVNTTPLKFPVCPSLSLPPPPLFFLTNSLNFINLFIFLFEKESKFLVCIVVESGWSALLIVKEESFCMNKKRKQKLEVKRHKKLGACKVKKKYCNSLYVDFSTSACVLLTRHFNFFWGNKSYIYG